MKHLFIASVLTLVIGSSACKKEKAAEPQPTPTEENFPEWVTYNTTNSALPSDQINAIMISKTNVKYIATANGLAKLDGDKWTIYNTSNTPLPSDMIQAIAVEADGTVWAGTDKGLARLKNGTWTIYTTANSVLTKNGIKCITHDAAHKTTWVGTEEGFVKIVNDQWEYIEEYNVLLSMATDRDGALWMGVFNDFAFIGMIKKYVNGQWTTYRLDQMGYTSAFAYDIEMDQNNRPVAILAGTVVKAAIRFNGNGWDELTRPEKARGFKALALYNDEVWVGGATFSRFGDKNSPVIAVTGTDSPIYCMAADASGRKWLGTYYGGVVVYNDAAK